MSKIPRRLVLRLAVLSAFASSAGCGEERPVSGLRCDDVDGLAENDAAYRRGQGYLDRSTRPGRRCENCRFYTAAPPLSCGACTLVRGPIHPEGYCNLWVNSEA